MARELRTPTNVIDYNREGASTALLEMHKVYMAQQQQLFELYLSAAKVRKKKFLLSPTCLTAIQVLASGWISTNSHVPETNGQAMKTVCIT